MKPITGHFIWLTGLVLEAYNGVRDHIHPGANYQGKIVNIMDFASAAREAPEEFGRRTWDLEIGNPSSDGICSYLRNQSPNSIARDEGATESAQIYAYLIVT